MSNEIKIKTNFIDYCFLVSKDWRDNIFSFIDWDKDKYYNNREKERKNLIKQVKEKKLDFSKIGDIYKINDIENIEYKKTVFYRNIVDKIFIELCNIENFYEINDKWRILILNVKNWLINHNPDYYDTYNWAEIPTNKSEFFIDDINQELLMSVKYKKIENDKFLIYWNISFMSHFNFLIKKSELYFIIWSFFEKNCNISNLNISEFEISYDSSSIINFITSPQKIKWIKYKAIPSDIIKATSQLVRWEWYQEQEIFIDAHMTKTNFLKITKDLQFKEVLESIWELKDIRIKTDDWLLKDENFRRQVLFDFNIDNKFNFMYLQEKKDYREKIKTYLINTINYDWNL